MPGDKKTTELTAITGANLADGDEFQVVDVSDTTMDPTGTTKKITRAEMVPGVLGVAPAGSVLVSDGATWGPRRGSYLVDLGAIDPLDLASGRAVAFTPAAGEYISAIRFAADSTYLDTPTIRVMFDTSDVPWLRDPLNTASGERFSYGYFGDGNLDTGDDRFTSSAGVLLASGQPLRVALGTVAGMPGTTRENPAWQAHTLFENGICVIAAGHLWAVSGDDGTSDSSAPDFAGNIGGTVTDNTITWTDRGALPAVGAVHAIVEIWTVGS